MFLREKLDHAVFKCAIIEAQRKQCLSLEKYVGKMCRLKEIIIPRPAKMFVLSGFWIVLPHL